MNNQTTIGILGSGTWGIALARLLHRNGHDVTVWSKFPKEIENLSATRTHPALPGLVIPETVHFTCDLQTVASGKDILLFAVPSIAIRQTAESARPARPTRRKSRLTCRLPSYPPARTCRWRKRCRTCS